MPNAKQAKTTAAGRRLVGSVKQAIAWADGKDVPARVTRAEVNRTAAIDLGALPETVRNGEQSRTKTEAARILVAVIARHPEAVKDALRKARQTPRRKSLRLGWPLI